MKEHIVTLYSELTAGCCESRTEAQMDRKVLALRTCVRLNNGKTSKHVSVCVLC